MMYLLQPEQNGISFRSNRVLLVAIVLVLIHTTLHKRRRKLDYPEETNGTRWAAEARKMASKLTPEEEAEHFRRAMVKVYGGQPKEIPGAGL